MLPASRDGDGGCRGREHVRDQRNLRHRDAECHRRVFAAGDGVEIARDEQRGGERHDQRRDRRCTAARRGEVAEQPEQHAPHRGVGCQGEQQGDERAPAGGDDHAGEQQPGRDPGNAGIAVAREPEHEQRRDERADERRQFPTTPRVRRGWR